jgi:hypothetical protein
MRIWLSFLIAIVLLAIAFARDLQYEKLYPDDLRNRVVGARLIADGKSPYFYKWKPEDGMRYYDPANFNTNIISNTTASPFLHSLVIPFSNLSQRTISFMWLLGQYIILIGMGLVAYRYAQGAGKHACLLLTGIFPYTDGWIRHVLTGQFYLLIPFLLFITYILLAGRQKNWRLIIAALCAVMVVLIRPFAALSFIPFLFILPVTKKFIVYSVAASAAYLLFVIASPHQMRVYKDYNQFIKYAVNEHQEKPLPTRTVIANPGFRYLEGYDINSIRLYKKKNPVKSFSENGNFFVLYRKVVGKQIPEQWLLAGSMLCTLLILLLFYFGTARNGRSLEQCVLVGFVIYMVLEMFLPMHRHQYNTVQFLFPLLLTAMHIRNLKLPVIVLIATGLLLNTLKWQVIPMKNTAGELLMLAGLLLATVTWNILRRSHDNPAPY